MQHPIITVTITIVFHRWPDVGNTHLNLFTMASYGPLQNTENEENPPVTMVVTLDNAPGSLANLLDVLRERGVNMSRIRSRPSATSPDEYEIELDVVTNSLSSDDIENLKTSLPGKKVQVAYQESTPSPFPSPSPLPHPSHHPSSRDEG